MKRRDRVAGAVEPPAELWTFERGVWADRVGPPPVGHGFISDADWLLNAELQAWHQAREVWATVNGWPTDRIDRYRDSIRRRRAARLRGRPDPVQDRRSSLGVRRGW